MIRALLFTLTTMSAVASPAIGIEADDFLFPPGPVLRDLDASRPAQPGFVRNSQLREGVSGAAEHPSTRELAALLQPNYEPDPARFTVYVFFTLSLPPAQAVIEKLRGFTERAGSPVDVHYVLIADGRRAPAEKMPTALDHVAVEIDIPRTGLSRFELRAVPAAVLVHNHRHTVHRLGDIATALTQELKFRRTP